ncbi:hypothetical protein D3C81_1455820 [compost metagenome]
MNVYIGMIAVIGNQKSKTLRMGLQPSTQQIHPLRYAIAAVPGQHNPAVLFELDQQVLKRLKRSAVLYRKMADQLIVSHRFISGFPHEIK